jgi:hypothetical protein
MPEGKTGRLQLVDDLDFDNEATSNQPKLMDELVGWTVGEGRGSAEHSAPLPWRIVPEKAGVGGSIPSLATIHLNNLDQIPENSARAIRP